MMMLVLGLILMAGPLFATPLVLDPENPEGLPGIKIKIWLYVEIGKRSLPDCPGFGLCYIKFGIDPSLKAGAPVNAAFGEGYFDDDGHFVIEFAKEYMSGETVATYFKSKFIVEENFEIPREVLDKFKHSGSYTIKAGQYSYTEKNGRLVTKF